MKTECSHCGNVYSITASPNGYEGYFITDIDAEKLGDIDGPSLLDISRLATLCN